MNPEIKTLRLKMGIYCMAIGICESLDSKEYAPVIACGIDYSKDLGPDIGYNYYEHYCPTIAEIDQIITKLNEVKEFLK